MTSDDAPAPLKLHGSSGVFALPKRFYKYVTIAEHRHQPPRNAAAGRTSRAGGEVSDPDCSFRIHLDGRPVRTPAKRFVEVPSEALASALVAEWDAQVAQIDPRTMPLTRLVNSALDGVAGREGEVAADIVAYAVNDLVCYRADHPPGLVAQQLAVWDPILDWAAVEFSGRFATAAGITHVAQEPAMLRHFAGKLAALTTLELAALHVMTTISGSALIVWAHAKGRINAETAWTAAHVDEDWQIAQWGLDGEAKARRQVRWLDFSAASRLLALRA